MFVWNCFRLVNISIKYKEFADFNEDISSSLVNELEICGQIYILFLKIEKKNVLIKHKMSVLSFAP